jgi:hypothetical protein
MQFCNRGCFYSVQKGRYSYFDRSKYFVTGNQLAGKDLPYRRAYALTQTASTDFPRAWRKFLVSRHQQRLEAIPHSDYSSKED